MPYATSQNMEENKPTLRENAMRYGTAMGIFWTLKFILFPLGMRNPMWLMLFFILTLAVPFVGYTFVRKYRDTQCQGSIDFSRAFMFSILMYMFAALFVTIIHYAYFRYIDNGLIISSYEAMLSQMESLAHTPDMQQTMEQLQGALDMAASLSPLDISLQLISQNIFYCTFIALPTAWIVKRNPKTI